MVRYNCRAERFEGVGEGVNVVAGEENVAAAAGYSFIRERQRNRQANHSVRPRQNQRQIFDARENHNHTFTREVKIRAIAKGR